MCFWRKYGAAINEIIVGIGVVAVFLLPAYCTLKPPVIGQCSVLPQTIVLDCDDIKDYSIAQGVCKDGATCECLPGDPHSITNAYIYNGNGRRYNLSVSDDRHHFNVVLPELNKPLPGIHTYRFGYDYECPYISLHLKCHKGKSKEMELTVKIVDYQLRVYDTSSSLLVDNNTEENLITYSQEVGSNITLLCSSSLRGVNDSALDIPVEFVFNSSGVNFTKSGKCTNTESINSNANWIISRQTFPPYDCTLTIVDFDSEDSGEYHCTGLLPCDDSQYEKDWSEVTIRLLNRDVPTKSFKRKSKYLPLISITALLLPCVIAIAFVVYKYNKRRQDHRPVITPASSTTSLISHRSLHQNYGTASSVGDLNIDLISNTTIVENEKEIESNIAQHTVKVSLEEPSAAGVHVSTISAGTEGKQYYEQYTDMQHPDGRQTPESSEAPLDENYKCHHCGKVYHSDQRLFYVRHMAELQQRCPDYKVGSGMNNANKNNLDSNATRLSDSFTPGPSEGDPRSRESTMSEIREGRGYYDDYTKMQVPDGGSTPEESEVPLDDHFKCPFCGKIYHKNQRLYFKRHVDELWYRCSKYDSVTAARGSSGSSSPGQSACEPPSKGSQEEQ